jgi:hypothetical protein
MILLNFFDPSNLFADIFAIAKTQLCSEAKSFPCLNRSLTFLKVESQICLYLMTLLAEKII